MPVHLYGQMADMDAIKEIADKYNLKVIEDACQAHGAEYKGHRAGSMGDAGCFSFFPSKNLGACGDGGMITTNNYNLYREIMMLRDYGQLKKYCHEAKGYNSRLDSVQAAILLAKLPYLDLWNDCRRTFAGLYDELLLDMDVVTPMINIDCRHVYHLYVIRTERRDEMLEYLKSKKIFCGIHYPTPIHLQNAYSAYRRYHEDKSDLLITEKCAKEILSLPMFPEITREQIVYVVKNIKEFLSK